VGTAIQGEEVFDRVDQKRAGPADRHRGFVESTAIIHCAIPRAAR
jgi:hypothetical protein